QRTQRKNPHELATKSNRYRHSEPGPAHSLYLYRVNSFPSKIFEQAVNEFATLPGIGRRSALRMVLHLLGRPQEEVSRFGETMIRLTREIRFCKNCHNISDTEICSICSDNRREQGLVCVVEDVRDLLAVENTGQYRGLYHVLGGIISPMDGIGPSN